ncbi:hypothetical protein IE4771_CH00556 [Rhizobium etli bv. mimosae str. IE4771]|uniref:Uncharacterized protein n=1 Tax=Rhizobium etli bv. mimosae str. IE4771 TaxID=1432050 RepID=A0A060HVW3_RHIET|nr:hypothetical protein IE4771_CH00556 [Rhizobium sp. IE4771]
MMQVEIGSSSQLIKIGSQRIDRSQHLFGVTRLWSVTASMLSLMLVAKIHF